MSIYRRPSVPLTEIVLAPPTPAVTLSPDNRWLLLMGMGGLPPLSELAERELHLAGIRIRPRTHCVPRVHGYTDFKLLGVEDGREISVGRPDGAPSLGLARFSPDSSRIAFTVESEAGVELWVAQTKTGEAKRLLGPELSFVANSRPKWHADSKSLFCSVVASNQPEPAPPLVPAGPIVQENLGKVTPGRTYQDLLRNPHDVNLFEHFFAAQLLRVHLDGRIEELGGPGLQWGFDPSPDGRYLLVVTLHPPYSYVVPAGRFPRVVEIWDVSGRCVTELVDRPLHEEMPIAFGSVCEGRRSFQWRSDAPATISWAEALDGGDAGAKADKRDRVFLLPAPFDGGPISLATLETRFGGISFGHDDLALVSAWWWTTRRVQLVRVRPGPAGRETVDVDDRADTLFDQSWEDRYQDPGNPELCLNQFGRNVLRTAEGGEAIFLIGDGASEEGDRPFLDRYDMNEKRATRLFQSEAPFFEVPVTTLGEGHGRLLTRRESRQEPPNYFVRDLKAGSLRKLTAFPDPTPQCRGVQREQIRYVREDGVKLSGTLFLPPNYDPKRDKPLPTLLWAYPQEFKSADAAGQIKDSPYRFDRIGWWSPVLWATIGYAVLDDPGMPIVGEGDREPNETFVEQLVASARAAVVELVRRGVGERGRFAVGGHSYGAFMAAHLLSHSDLFAAGIARSGAYNRTLTPFGFQAEERSLWEATDVYINMSPFVHAHKVKPPLLLIHGEKDSNSGTYPLQSERYYSALKGHGATTRLVLLPFEDHQYLAEESVLHVIWETEQWLEHYVKQADASQ